VAGAALNAKRALFIFSPNILATFSKLRPPK
jgi:hypothetical protein